MASNELLNKFKFSPFMDERVQVCLKVVCIFNIFYTLLTIYEYIFVWLFFTTHARGISVLIHKERRRKYSMHVSMCSRIHYLSNYGKFYFPTDARPTVNYLSSRLENL